MYKLTFWYNDASFAPARLYISRKQAIHGMRKFAYDKLGWFAKLDTQAAHDVMAEIDKADDVMAAIDRANPQETRRAVDISNTGYTVVLSNTTR